MTEHQKISLILFDDCIREMQGRVFYCEDDEGVLRRWVPPKPVNLEALHDLIRKLDAALKEIRKEARKAKPNVDAIHGICAAALEADT